MSVPHFWEEKKRATEGHEDEDPESHNSNNTRDMFQSWPCNLQRPNRQTKKFEHVQGLENIPGRRRVPMHESGVPYSFSLARCRVRGL